ncbi:hypothetical protein NQ315_017363 [Exocentrus adspersus]|uniref:Tyr recombinase domain-containing protein n=1 Tax=Exocentrus adspersus TaxID=1586481 RepID=A0AAV8VLK5_9CUCU|nr:hypothetical protein NQ315_017363 [Exocentrus adspersus]
MEEFTLTPPEIIEAAKEIEANLLPEKSQKIYKQTYKKFFDYCTQKKSYSENVLLVYFGELSKKMKSSTLWSVYSMLRATLNIYNKVDITLELEAPDDTYLSTKVTMIFAVAGACRCDELLQLKVIDIEDMQNKLLISLPITKTKRLFVASEHLNIYRKYNNARPIQMDSERFFFKYSNGKAYN